MSEHSPRKKRKKSSLKIINIKKGRQKKHKKWVISNTLPWDRVYMLNMFIIKPKESYNTLMMLFVKTFWTSPIMTCEVFKVLSYEVDKPFKILIKTSNITEYIESAIQNIEVPRIYDPIDETKPRGHWFHTVSCQK